MAKSTNQSDTCPLCLTPCCLLQKSHLFPAAAYKRMRGTSSGNQNPVWTGPRKEAIQTSYQIQDYLLCSACEQRLRANGEDWMMRNCWHPDGRFPLQEILKKTTPDEQSEHTKLFCASKISEINVAAITYFAASIFWRASVHNWDTGATADSLKGLLGPYEEQFRRYLMGLDTFPEHAAVWVAVPSTLEEASCSGVMGPNRGKRHSSCTTHEFLFLGVSFRLFVGKGMDDYIKLYCLLRGHGNTIALTNILDLAIDYRWRAVARKKPLRASSNV